MIPHKFETNAKTPCSILLKVMRVKKSFSPSVRKNFIRAIPAYVSVRDLSVEVIEKLFGQVLQKYMKIKQFRRAADNWP